MDVFARAELARLVDRGSYPGIEPDEVRALREWIRRHGDRFEELRFNVRVGAGVKLGGDFPEKFRDDWETRTKMKLDCVAWNPPHTATLIEVKVQWTNAAVWQLASYRDAYAVDYPDATIELVGVCEAFTPQALALAGSQGITLYTYGFSGDFSSASSASVDRP